MHIITSTPRVLLLYAVYDSVAMFVCHDIILRHSRYCLGEFRSLFGLQVQNFHIGLLGTNNSYSIHGNIEQVSSTMLCRVVVRQSLRPGLGWPHLKRPGVHPARRIKFPRASFNTNRLPVAAGG